MCFQKSKGTAATAGQNQTEAETQDQEPQRTKREATQEGTATPGATTTSEAQPNPTEKASEAQEPEPPPADQRNDGTTPGGQQPEGQQTNKPDEATHARTTATERSAKAPRPTPKDDAEKTEADGKKRRTTMSTPHAQPTNTEAAGGTNAQRRNTEAQARGQEREPEKAKEEKQEKGLGEPRTEATTAKN